jgi:acetyl-CoA C-acetyltransferase
LQASALEAQVAGLHTVAASVAEKNRAHGRIAYPDFSTRSPAGAARWPLTAEMISAPVTGCVAMVLAAEDFVTARGVKDVAWLRGMGWATEAAFLGDRVLSTAPALVEAARQAYAAAGIRDPAVEIDVVEITDATPYAELLAYEALSLCAREDWAARVAEGLFTHTGKIPVNLSGGVLTFNPVFCTGLIRIAEIANQVRGRARAHQLENVRTGLAHAGSGFAMQYQAAIVLGRDAETRA